MTLEDIKNWIEETLAVLEDARDTDDQWQKKTRKLLGRAYRNRLAIKDWVQTNKPAALPYLAELKTLFEDYYKYFLLGYRASTSIDNLPRLIKEKLTFIQERIDSL